VAEHYQAECIPLKMVNDKNGDADVAVINRSEDA